MKYFVRTLITVLITSLVLLSCGSSKNQIDLSEEEKAVFENGDKDTVKIADAESKYEILIIEPGFYNWLNSIARPEGYYSQHFLENRNELLVLEWNRRAMLPTQYDPQLYMWQINYDPWVDYGYDVNYKLYNYFVYIQRKYNQRLSLFVPRI
ncbi:MAG: DUF6146 family protein [Flavobacteriaceae bacterium]